jgi:hypothetical protein
VTGWEPLDPYRGEETEPLTGAALADLVAFYKRTADQNGEPYDPEWDQWLADDDPSTDRLRD